MKLSQMVTQEKSNNKKYENLSSTEVADKLYSDLARSLHDERTKRRQAEARIPDPVTIEISGNELQLKKSIYDKTLQQRDTLRRTLAKTSVLDDLAPIIKLTLDLSKAIYRSGKMLSSSQLFMKDPDGKPTKDPLRNEKGEDLFNVDPISQLKAVLYVLEHNEQAKQALATLRESLKDLTPSRLKELEVTKEVLESPVPTKPKFRTPPATGYSDTLLAQGEGLKTKLAKSKQPDITD